MVLAIHAQMTTDPTGSDLLFFACPYSSFVSSRIMVSAAGSSGAFTLYAVPSGDTDGPASHHLLYNAFVVSANTTLEVPPGITLEEGDELWVKGSSVLTVTLFGEGIEG